MRRICGISTVPDRARRGRPPGAPRRGHDRAGGRLRPHGDGQGALSRFQDHHAEPHRTLGNARIISMRTNRSPGAHAPCSTGRTRAIAPSGCSASDCRAWRKRPDPPRRGGSVCYGSPSRRRRPVLDGCNDSVKLTCHVAFRHICLRRASRLREAGRRLSRPRAAGACCSSCSLVASRPSASSRDSTGTV